MYKELDYINSALRMLGELPVNDVNAPHPQVPAIRAALNDQSVRVQADGWWFNTEYPTLTPQVGNGLILLPANTLSVDAVATAPAVTFRDDKLYNTRDSTFVWTSPVKVRLIRWVAFDELPYSARFFLTACAQLSLAGDLDADSTKIRLITQAKSEGYTMFNAEHIRNTQANLMDRPTFAYRIREVIGDTPFGQRFIR